MKCCQSKSCRWLLGLRPGNSIIVFEIILTDVIADLHTAHHMPPGTIFIVLGTAVDRDKDHSFRRRITSSAISPYGVQPLVPTIAD
jgi:hypothetical protein